MPDILPQTPATNIRKWIFVGGFLGVVFLVVAFFVFMSGGGGTTAAGKGFNPDSKQVTVWAVGMDAKLSADLNDAFNTYLGRSDMKLDVKNFTSFEDYADMLPRAMQSDAPPDIVMVPNHGGYHFFDQYINSLGSDLVDFTDFETRFHKLFFEELVFQETIKGGGQDKVIQGLRGVPFGFEPLGIYYNRDLVAQVPARWSTLPDILKPNQEEIDVADPENKSLLNVSSPKNITNQNPAFINIGYGAATSSAADIITLLGAQRKGTLLTSYASLNSTDSRSIFDYFMSFRREPNNLSRFAEDFDQTLTTTDLFVRGKIATLIGYPSTYQDIEIAIQRAKQDNQLAPSFLKNLRITTVPQDEVDPKKQINLAKYMYFALTKNGAHRNTKKPSNDPVLKFIQFLLTPEAQAVFIKHPNYLLPTQNTTLTEGKDNKINPDTDFSMTVADWYVPGQTFALYDMGIPHLFRAIIRQALDEPGATAGSVASFVSSYMACKIGQLTDPAQYSKACLCQTKLPTNRNNYWPLCSQE